MQLIDTYQRKINYLRLSVTDRCNLRCRYCMPAAGVPKLAAPKILSYEELYRVVNTAVSLGIEKVRVTGGEPLVRKGITDFLSQLSRIPGLRQLVLTTNGLLLEGMAEELRAVGVQRLNISLDSLRPETFRDITRGGELSRVLAGIAAAERAGFQIKLNVVVMRGINEKEIENFAALTLDKPWSVRFIEYMPAIKDANWQDQVVPGQKILERIAEKFSFHELHKEELAGPSRDYRIEGALGTIGVITPVFGHFCGDCNRMRVTASGRVRSCLFAESGVDLRPFLLAQDDNVLEGALRRLVLDKPERHGLSTTEADHEAFAMASIGG